MTGAYFAGRSAVMQVGRHADRDVAFVAGHRELVGDGPALVGKLATVIAAKCGISVPARKQVSPPERVESL